MGLLDKLGEDLDKEIKGEQKTPQTPNNMEELYQHLIEKKFKDMELRLDNMVKSLIEKNKNITDTNTPLDEGGEEEKNDSNTDVPVSE